MLYKRSPARIIANTLTYMKKVQPFRVPVSRKTFMTGGSADKVGAVPVSG
jgi:hypothetical protein